MARHRNDGNCGWRHACRSARLLLVSAVALTITTPAAFSQAMMNRGPSVNNINVGPRGPNLNIGPSISPTVRYSPNLNYDDEPTRSPRRTKSTESGSPQGQSSGDGSVKKAKKTAPTANDQRFVAKEVLIEVDGNPSDAEADAIARRHRLTRVQSQNFPLIGSTMYRWRISDSRSVSAVVRELVADNVIKSAQ